MKAGKFGRCPSNEGYYFRHTNNPNNMVTPITKISIAIISTCKVSNSRPAASSFRIHVANEGDHEPPSKNWSARGIEPRTSCTRSRNHASRPSGRHMFSRKLDIDIEIKNSLEQAFTCCDVLFVFRRCIEYLVRCPIIGSLTSLLLSVKKVVFVLSAVPRSTNVPDTESFDCQIGRRLDIRYHTRCYTQQCNVSCHSCI
jgi:hypothetical protein